MMSYFRHILVPLNFSAQNDMALDVVQDFASAGDVKVTLLHVIEPINAADDSEIQDFLRQLGESANASLVKRKKRFDHTKITVACENRIGNRTKEIVTFADENDVDLIVLSSHQLRQPESTRQIASLSNQISIFANCSVLLVK